MTLFAPVITSHLSRPEWVSVLRALGLCALLALCAVWALSDLADVLDRRRGVAALEARLDAARAAPPRSDADALLLPPGPITFAGRDKALASAALQQKIAVLAGESGATIVSMATNDPPQGPAVRLEVEVSTDQLGLLRLVHSVETAMPFMFIAHMAIGPAAATPGAASAPRFTVTLRLEAMTEGDEP